MEKTETVSFTATGSKVTVTDTMGNAREYIPVNGKVLIPLSGSAVYIQGVR